MNSNSSSEEDENANESIIEREIRLQQERERELELRRQQLMTTSIQSSEPEVTEIIETEQITVEYSEPVCNSPTPVSTPDDLSDAEQPPVPETTRTRMSYEEAIASNSHDGESLIARELREAREKEEELARQRQVAIGSKAVATPPVKQEVRASVKETVANQNKPTYQKDVSPFKNGRRQSQDSLSSHSTDRSSSGVVQRTPKVKVSAFADDSYITPERTEPVKKEKQETPIEREIRLARERENEFRVAKGLPPLKDEKKEEVEKATTDISYNAPKQKPLTASSRQKFASSRLQKEINRQNELEKKYRDEGKIKSTSEEHVGLIKFSEIASESTPKRNFSITKKSAGIPVVIKENGAQEEAKQSTPKTQTPEQQPTTKFNRSISSGGVTFSYKESRHKAESKIEQELREMREREDELRKQRQGSGLVSPRDPDSPRSPSTVTNKRSQFEQKS